MHPAVREELRVQRLQLQYELAAHGMNIRKLCKEYNVKKSTYYYWKKRFDALGKNGLYRRKPIPYSTPRKTRPQLLKRYSNFEIPAVWGQ
jgi:transposase